MEISGFEGANINFLSDIIKKGQIVGVKTSVDGEWINDVILGVDDTYNSINIELLEEFINNDLMIEDNIQCKLIDDDIIYILEGLVKDIGLISPKQICIEITSLKKYPNDRGSKRFTVNLCGRIIYDNQEKSTFVTVKNISSTGVSVVSKYQLKLFEEVDIDIIIWEKEVISIEGKIVRMIKSGGNYKYGILIEAIDNKSKKMLCEFMDEMEYFESIKRLIEE